MWGRTSLVPRRSLLIRCPREVWERAGERTAFSASISVTSQLMVESRNDRAENAWGLSWGRSDTMKDPLRALNEIVHGSLGRQEICGEIINCSLHVVTTITLLSWFDSLYTVCLRLILFICIMIVFGINTKEKTSISADKSQS